MTELGQAIFDHTIAILLAHASHSSEEDQRVVAQLEDTSDALAKALTAEIASAVLNTEVKT